MEACEASPVKLSADGLDLAPTEIIYRLGEDLGIFIFLWIFKRVHNMSSAKIYHKKMYIIVLVD